MICIDCIHYEVCEHWKDAMFGSDTLYPETVDCKHYKPVRHGDIIQTVKNGKMKQVFSCCNTDFTELTMWCSPNYCPNCGAKMDGGKSNG